MCCDKIEPASEQPPEIGTSEEDEVKKVIAHKSKDEKIILSKEAEKSSIKIRNKQKQSKSLDISPIRNENLLKTFQKYQNISHDSINVEKNSSLEQFNHSKGNATVKINSESPKYDLKLNLVNEPKQVTTYESEKHSENSEHTANTHVIPGDKYYLNKINPSVNPNEYVLPDIRSQIEVETSTSSTTTYFNIPTASMTKSKDELDIPLTEITTYDNLGTPEAKTEAPTNEFTNRMNIIKVDPETTTRNSFSAVVTHATTTSDITLSNQHRLPRENSIFKLPPDNHINEQNISESTTYVDFETTNNEEFVRESVFQNKNTTIPTENNIDLIPESLVFKDVIAKDVTSENPFNIIIKSSVLKDIVTVKNNALNSITRSGVIEDNKSTVTQENIPDFSNAFADSESNMTISTENTNAYTETSNFSDSSSMIETSENNSMDMTTEYSANLYESANTRRITSKGLANKTAFTVTSGNEYDLNEESNIEDSTRESNFMSSMTKTAIFEDITISATPENNSKYAVSGPLVLGDKQDDENEILKKSFNSLTNNSTLVHDLPTQTRETTIVSVNDDSDILPFGLIVDTSSTMDTTNKFLHKPQTPLSSDSLTVVNTEVKKFDNSDSNPHNSNIHNVENSIQEDDLHTQIPKTSASINDESDILQIRRSDETLTIWESTTKFVSTMQTTSSDSPIENASSTTEVENLDISTSAPFNDDSHILTLDVNDETPRIMDLKNESPKQHITIASDSIIQDLWSTTEVGDLVTSDTFIHNFNAKNLIQDDLHKQIPTSAPINDGSDIFHFSQSSQTSTIWDSTTKVVSKLQTNSESNFPTEDVPSTAGIKDLDKSDTNINKSNDNSIQADDLHTQIQETTSASVNDESDVLSLSESDDTSTVRNSTPKVLSKQQTTSSDLPIQDILSTTEFEGLESSVIDVHIYENSIKHDDLHIQIPKISASVNDELDILSFEDTLTKDHTPKLQTYSTMEYVLNSTEDSNDSATTINSSYTADIEENTTSISEMTQTEIYQETTANGTEFAPVINENHEIHMQNKHKALEFTELQAKTTDIPQIENSIDTDLVSSPYPISKNKDLNFYVDDHHVSGTQDPILILTDETLISQVSNNLNTTEMIAHLDTSTPPNSTQSTFTENTTNLSNFNKSAMTNNNDRNAANLENLEASGNTYTLTNFTSSINKSVLSDDRSLISNQIENNPDFVNQTSTTNNESAFNSNNLNEISYITSTATYSTTENEVLSTSTLGNDLIKEDQYSTRITFDFDDSSMGPLDVNGQISEEYALDMGPTSEINYDSLEFTYRNEVNEFQVENYDVKHSVTQISSSKDLNQYPADPSSTTSNIFNQESSSHFEYVPQINNTISSLRPVDIELQNFTSIQSNTPPHSTTSRPHNLQNEHTPYYSFGITLPPIHINNKEKSQTTTSKPPKPSLFSWIYDIFN